MSNVLNPEPESITLNTELETPTLEPATELDSHPRIDQPSPESTSNTETAEAVAAVEPTALDADALTEPVAQAAPVEHATVEAAPAASQAEATPADLRELAAPADGPPLPETAEASEEQWIQAQAEPAHESHGSDTHSGETMDDFSAALAAFEREQAAEAAAVEAYGDKVVSGTVRRLGAYRAGSRSHRRRAFQSRRRNRRGHRARGA
jgi:small subunit ribosomal protein S1